MNKNIFLKMIYLFVMIVMISACGKVEQKDNQLLCSIEYPNGKCPVGKSCIDGSCQIECTDKCESWESCINGDCKLSVGRCNNDDDCLLKSSKCINHICNKEIDLCEGISCSDHGKCLVNENNEPFCKCDDEYVNSNLECVTPCEGISCSDHGKCEFKEGKNSCKCDEGYHNIDLECIKKTPCDNFICGSNEMCKFTGETARCVCAQGYIKNEDTCRPLKSIDWNIACPNYVEGDRVECGLMPVPLDYSKPDGKKIDIFVYRYLSDSMNKKGQFVFLQGGPGGSGAIFSRIFGNYREKYPDYDFYSLDHRGVGNSIDLDCGVDLNNLDNFKYCVSQLNSEWGDDIKQFSTNNAAKDLGYLFANIKESNIRQNLYGVSYGTYWAEKYLYFYPDQIDAVVLDSIASINATWIDTYNVGLKTVGDSFLNIASEDFFVKRKISTDLHIALNSYYEKVKNGEGCNINDQEITVKKWKMIFGAVLMNYYARRLIPSLIYRLNRCDNEKDIPVLTTFLENLSDIFGRSVNFFVDYYNLDSDVLYYNVTFSELWKGISLEEILEIENSSLFTASSLEDMYSFYHEGGWNIYLDDGTFRAWPEVTIPILMLNGTLDPQTPLELAYPSKEHFNKANQVFVEFPETPHGVIFYTFVKSDDNILCGEKIMMEFIDDPTKKVNKSCINQMHFLEFSDSDINRYISNNFYNTDDMWEGTISRSHKNKIDEKIKKSFFLNKTLY